MADMKPVPKDDGDTLSAMIMTFADESDANVWVMGALGIAGLLVVLYIASRLLDGLTSRH